MTSSFVSIQAFLETVRKIAKVTFPGFFCYMFVHYVLFQTFKMLKSKRYHQFQEKYLGFQIKGAHYLTLTMIRTQIYQRFHVHNLKQCEKSKLSRTIFSRQITIAGLFYFHFSSSRKSYGTPKLLLTTAMVVCLCIDYFSQQFIPYSREF